MISPASRSGAGSIETISWRPPAHPTVLVSIPRSARVNSSTGFDFAAMIPLNEGYRGSTTPAVTDTRAGSGQSTSSYPSSVCLFTATYPLSTVTSFAKVTDGRPSNSATCSGTVPVYPSEDSVAARTRSGSVLCIAAARTLAVLKASEPDKASSLTRMAPVSYTHLTLPTKA